MVFTRIKEMFGNKGGEEHQEYLEVDVSQPKEESKINVKTFILRTYEDVTPILNSLREGYTIAVIDIKTLKSKDVVELKRAISKVKKTIEALEGHIAGFGDNVVIAAPSFASIQRGEVVESTSPKHDRLERF
jgi:SepF-like predicted cell division protein (DUF552 family)